MGKKQQDLPNASALDGSEKILALQGGVNVNVSAQSIADLVEVDATEPADGSITNPKLSNAPTATVKGRTTAGTGPVTDVPIATTLKTALALVKADVGLGSVDNTADADKPISTDQAAVNSAKLDKDFALLTLINRNLTTDDLIPMLDGIANKSLSPQQLEQWIQSIPYGLTGDKDQDDTTAFETLRGQLLTLALGESPTARATLMIPQGKYYLNGDGKKVMGYSRVDAFDHHPAIDLRGPARGKAHLRQNDGQALIRGVRTFIRVQARCKGVQSYDAWATRFENLVIDGNKTNQTEEPGWVVYIETGSDDPDFAYWQAQPGGAGVKGYSGCEFHNCEIVEGLGGIFVGGNRQRFRFIQSRTLNHGLSTGSVVDVAGVGLRLLGNDAVLMGFDAGGCTSHSVSASGCSGVTLTQPNVWNPKADVCSDTAHAVFFNNLNGASITGGTVNGIILIDGGADNSLREVEINGVSMRPLNDQFAANGVTAGTVSDDYFSQIVVRGAARVRVSTSFHASTPDFWAFRHSVTAIEGAMVTVNDYIEPSAAIGSGKPYAISAFNEDPDDSGARIFVNHVKQSTGEREITGRVLFSSGAVDLPTPIAGLRRLRIDASRGMRGNQTISVSSGSLTIGASTLTVNLPSNHDSYTGAVWFVFSQQDGTATALDLETAGYGEITRVDADTFTIPRVRGSATGTNTSKFWAVCMSRKTHQSPDLAFDHWTNHLMTDFANFSAGSNSSIGLALAHDLAKDYVDSFDVLDVTFGTGNDVLAAINDAVPIATMVTDTIGRVREYLSYWVSRGKLILFNGIPPSDSSTGASTAYGVAMDEALRTMIYQEFQGKVFHVQMLPLLLLPGSNLKDPATGNSGSGVHDNEAGAYVVGYNKAEMWASVCPIPPGPPLIYSADDRYGQSSSSYQIIDAAYAGLTKAASGLDTEFSGTCMEEYDNQSNVTTGGGACTIVAAVVDEPDGYGKMQTFDFTIPNGGNVCSLVFSGKTGTDLIFDRLVAGEEYEGWMRHYVEPSQAALLSTYEIRFMGVVSGNTVVLSGAVEQGIAFPDDVQAHPRELVLKFPRFKVPASGLTSAYIEMKYNFASSQTGTCRVEHSRWAMRRIRNV